MKKFDVNSEADFEAALKKFFDYKPVSVVRSLVETFSKAIDSASIERDIQLIQRTRTPFINHYRFKRDRISTPPQKINKLYFKQL